MQSISHKDLIVFDLDGTLAESKTTMDTEMSMLLNQLLNTHHVAIISGGSHAQLMKQFLAGLTAEEDLLPKVHLFPTCGAQCYQYEDNEWQERYAHHLTPEEKRDILSAFEDTFHEAHYKHPEKIYGDVIEDRGTQITFSAVGQKAPVEAKALWNKQYNDTRLSMMEKLQERLPDFDVRIGGMTSIDVTRKGINKFHGIQKIKEITGVPIERMLFIGDALYPGGNDEPVKLTGVETIEVRDPEETKVFIDRWVNKNL